MTPQKLEDVGAAVPVPAALQQALSAPTGARFDRAIGRRAPAESTSDEKPSGDADEPGSSEEPLPLQLVEAPKTFEELARLADADPVPDAEADDDAPASEPAPTVRGDAPVRLDRERYAVRSAASFYRGVATDCLERAMIMAKDRDERPLRERPRLEARLLAEVDAFVCTGPEALDVLLDWHEQASSPWATWVAVFFLACLDGREPLELVRNIVVALPVDAREPARLAAEAFAATANPQAAPLGRALLASESPAARACGIELLSLRGMMAASDLLAWLRTPDLVVQVAAMRALVRQVQISTAPPGIQGLLDSADAELAWETARALTMWRDPRPLEAIREAAPLRELLGAHALEILVMAGTLDDVAVVEEITRAHPMTPAMLDAVARFGHAGTWAFLASYLADPVLAPGASRALRTLFGDCVTDEGEFDGGAWEAAIAKLGLQTNERYRHGKVWTREVADDDRQSTERSRVLAERRDDELRARGGPVLPWLGAWSAPADTAIT